ncbi:MAG TPA: SDR family NAD(P)-dependent oxidoreductase [Chloroflexia bacterium]|nr:SDR family NAD(P)-dependent oxidoreductase [Chloroflexia bacterium]
MQTDKTGPTGVLVTGAGVGIGFEVARRFALGGAPVALNDLDPALAERAAAAINAEAGAERVRAYGLDVADVAAVRAMVAEADERLGGLRVLVANAGLTNYGGFLDYTPEAFDRLTSVNLRGSYFTAQAAAKAMIARGTRGRILLMSSVTGQRAFMNLSAYGITKAALRHMAATLALELGPHGLTVNALGPGAIMTERTLADDPHLEESWAGVTPTGRVGYVADVAAAALFLASPEAGHISGQTLMVDGGWTLASPIPAAHPALPTTGSQLK